MTREQMIDRIIEDEYDGMDYKSLWDYFEHYQQQEYSGWTDEQISRLYKETFDNE